MRSSLATALVLLGMPAFAEIRAAAADGFSIVHVFELSVDPQAAYRILAEPQSWWPAAHTWSGKAENLSLEPTAGGCFCERWDGGSVEHGRVVMAVPGRTLRIVGALGPLQEMALSAVLTVTLEGHEKGTRATVTYRVSGDSTHGLTGLTPVVNRVLGEQFGRFARRANGVRLD